MNISKVRIKNYRGIKEDEFENSNFVCVIGENNAGKSTTLLAISLFFSGTALSNSDYYDPSEPIYIEITFSNILEGDLKRLSEEHRDRIRSIIHQDGSLTLTRFYSTGANRSEILCNRLSPKDNKFSRETTDSVLKGKRGKEIETAIISIFPEYKEEFAGFTTQKEVNSKLEEIIKTLPPDKLEVKLSPLPTGIDAAIKSFLPEPIYIAAVKDLKDEVKNKDSSSFGKLLGILLKSIEGSDKFKEILSSFDTLHAMLNRINSETGIQDGRIELLQSIEGLISKYLKENFPKAEIELEIPKPELKQIFSNAKILVDDGVRDLVDTKGDGLKRSVTFALLRSYVEYSKNKKKVDTDENTEDKPLEQPYVFLFEEPELFLHPNAQLILFEALEKLTQIGNQVFVTTHSPLFFSPRTTGTFIKVTKHYPENNQRPFGKLISVDLSKEVTIKDAFQIMCYENNAAAFFSNKVLLVEGDCDYIYIKEIAKKINSDWGFDYRNIPVIKIDGKGNVKRFKDFYNRFNIDVYVLLDLDALIEGFNLLGLPDEINSERDSLLNIIDRLAIEKGYSPNMNGKKVKEITERRTWQQKYLKLKEYANRVKIGEKLDDSEIQDIEYLFLEEENSIRKQVLKDIPPVQDRDILLDKLKEHKIFILSRGAIESYYPPNVHGGDKPTKALNAVSILQTIDDHSLFLPKVIIEGKECCELSTVFNRIFS